MFLDTKCAFNAAVCRAEDAGGSLTKVADGVCCSCPKDIDTVCGSDGKFYGKLRL